MVNIMYEEEESSFLFLSKIKKEYGK